VRKVALLFILAVLAPSLVLAWIAARSARDQQIIVAQQQKLIYQGIADTLATDIREFMRERQRDFARTVEALRQKHPSVDLGREFDDLLRAHWPYADVGFAMTIDGSVLSPSLFGRAEARQFRLNNDRFLCAGEPVQVYWNSPKTVASPATASMLESQPITGRVAIVSKAKAIEARMAMPSPEKIGPVIGPESAEFKELVGDAFEGTVARFLQNRLKVLLWYRDAREPGLIYGAQLNLTNVAAELASLIRIPDHISADASVALLNDGHKLVAGTMASSPPFAVSEVGYVLPHWKIAVSLKRPETLTRSARSLQLTLLLVVLLMIAAIIIGSALIGADLKRQLTLARQKTDFVSNVSHELKTPLTSIRMFSELLANGRVADETQRRHFLGIITSETARLSRLINNVLDFARLDRGETGYRLEPCDLKDIVRAAVESCRPQLEAAGFKLQWHMPAAGVAVNGNSDALAQVLLNLLSNAEKYSGDAREIDVELRVKGDAAEVRVLDRGPGVPAGAEEAIFEQFYRAHDSLSSGIQGCGLGLTLARGIARAHAGDLHYEPRAGGGSSFVLRIPILQPASAAALRQT
jgi:signal transduction histidine kinase